MKYQQAYSQEIEIWGRKGIFISPYPVLITVDKAEDRYQMKIDGIIAAEVFELEGLRIQYYLPDYYCYIMVDSALHRWSDPSGVVPDQFVMAWYADDQTLSVLTFGDVVRFLARNDFESYDQLKKSVDLNILEAMDANDKPEEGPKELSLVGWAVYNEIQKKGWRG